MSSIRLHHKHGLAPVLMSCPICHEDTGIVLTGASFNKMFPGVKEPDSRQRVMDQNPCDKCTGMLKDGATAFVSPDHRTMMIRKEAAERMGCKTGVIYQVTDEWMTENQPKEI